MKWLIRVQQDVNVKLRKRKCSMVSINSLLIDFGWPAGAAGIAGAAPAAALRLALQVVAGRRLRDAGAPERRRRRRPAAAGAAGARPARPSRLQQPPLRGPGADRRRRGRAGRRRRRPPRPAEGAGRGRRPQEEASHPRRWSVCKKKKKTTLSFKEYSIQLVLCFF